MCVIWICRWEVNDTTRLDYCRMAFCSHHFKTRQTMIYWPSSQKFPDQDLGREWIRIAILWAKMSMQWSNISFAHIHAHTNIKPNHKLFMVQEFDTRSTLWFMFSHSAQYQQYIFSAYEMLMFLRNWYKINLLILGMHWCICRYSVSADKCNVSHYRPNVSKHGRLYFWIKGRKPITTHAVWLFWQQKHSALLGFRNKK